MASDRELARLAHRLFHDLWKAGGPMTGGEQYPNMLNVAELLARFDAHFGKLDQPVVTVTPSKIAEEIYGVYGSSSKPASEHQGVMVIAEHPPVAYLAKSEPVKPFHPASQKSPKFAGRDVFSHIAEVIRPSYPDHGVPEFDIDRVKRLHQMMMLPEPSPDINILHHHVVKLEQIENMLGLERKGKFGERLKRAEKMMGVAK